MNSIFTSPFFDAVSRFPLAQKIQLGRLINEQPELLAFLEELFYKKLIAMKNLDQEAIVKICDDEKKRVLSVLVQLIKEQ